MTNTTQTTEDYEDGHGIPQSVIDQAEPSVPEECHLLTNKPAMTLEEQAVEAAGIILHAAGSSLRNYTPRAKDEILACTRHALTEAYDRGRRDGLDSQAQDDGLRNRIIELEDENARLTAQVAAGDVLLEAAQRVINSVSPCTHAERASVSSLYKQITAYDTAKENLND